MPNLKLWANSIVPLFSRNNDNLDFILSLETSDPEILS